MSDSNAVNNKNNNQINADDLDLETLAITDEMVSTYLQDNPDFFARNPNVVANLRFSDNSRGVVSLVERQQQIQRQKIHLLEEEITSLLTVANYNEQLFTVYNDLYLNLIDSNNPSEFLDYLTNTTTQLLNLSSFKLFLTNKEFELGHESIVKNDCSSIIEKRFANSEYYFGRLGDDEKQQLFADAVVGSVVLVQLSHEDECLGFIAIASSDAEHFNPSMDTLLLNQFRTLVAKLLVKQLRKIGL